MATAITQEELVRLETQYWQAMKDGDVETALRLTDTPCIVAGPQGVGSIDRKGFEAMLRATDYRIDRFELKDGAQMRRLGDDVAVLAYEVHEELTVDGKRVSIDAADCSTWVRRDGRWACALHSETIEGDAFGRDRSRAPPAVAPAYE
jgi:hypothetical protein